MAAPKAKATKPKAPRVRKPKVADEPMLDIELPNYDSAHDPFSLMNPYQPTQPAVEAPLTKTEQKNFDALVKHLKAMEESYHKGFGSFSCIGFCTRLEHKAGAKRPFIIKGIYLKGQFTERSFDDFSAFSTFVMQLMNAYAVPELSREVRKLDRDLSQSFGPWLSQMHVYHEIGKEPRIEHRNLLDGIGGDGIATSFLYDTVEDAAVAARYYQVVSPPTWRRYSATGKTFDPNLSVEEMRAICFPKKKKPLMTPYGVCIEFKQGDGTWAELPGHGCYTETEAQQYCTLLGNGQTFRIKYEEAA